MRIRGMQATLLIVAVLFTAGTTAGTLSGRQAVEKQKQIIEAKKRLVVDRNEVHEFASLLQELGDANKLRVRKVFWEVDAEVRRAMEREFEQARRRITGAETSRRVQKAGPAMHEGLELPPLDGVALEEKERITRMQHIILEADGLRSAMATGESDLMQRYMLLLDNFLEVMEEDLRAAAAAIDVAESELAEL